MQEKDLTRIVEQNRMILEHLWMVRAIALRMKSTLLLSADFDEIMSAGYLGLVLAARRFEGRNGCKFSTYAFPYIRGMMIKSFTQVDCHKHSAMLHWVPLPDNLHAAKDIEADFYRSELRTQLASAIKDLQVHQRAIIEAVYLEERSVLSIAKDWNVKPNRLFKWKRSAVKRLSVKVGGKCLNLKRRGVKTMPEFRSRKLAAAPVLLLAAVLVAHVTAQTQTPIVTRVEIDTPQGRTVNLRAGRNVPITVKAFGAKGEEVLLPSSSFWPAGWLPGGYVHCARVENFKLIAQAGSLPTCGVTLAVFNGFDGTLASGVSAEPITVNVLPALAPRLFTASGRAVAVHSTQQTLDPFTLETPSHLNFSSDTVTRIQVFVEGGDASPATALQAEFERSGVVRAGVVEDVRPTNAPGIWQVTIRLPDLPAGDHMLTVIWDGFRSTAGLIAVN